MATKNQSMLLDPYEFEFPCIKLEQPIGVFFIAAIDHASLREMTFSDVRRMHGDREFEAYLGIQRKLSPTRVEELVKYVGTIDATFPTAVVLAVEARHAEFSKERGTLTIRNYDASLPEGERVYVEKTDIAKVLDGQHRIDGLKNFSGKFDVNVSIFVDMDIENQAYVFSTVNLAQTKVNKSLVYDLLEYAAARSPQKTCHNIAVALDKEEHSPFLQRIKRLGTATKGRDSETITQATFVEALLPYLTADKIKDRDLFRRGKTPARATSRESETLIFRNMFLEERDLEIAGIVYDYFSAVSERWDFAWNSGGQGYILNKTNGFNALMRLLRPAYRYFASPGEKVGKVQFATLFKRCKFADDYFTTENFLPGTSGQTKLFQELMEQTGLERATSVQRELS